MYLYLVIFLRLFNGLCFLYCVTGVQGGIAVSRRKSWTVDSRPVSLSTEITRKPFTGSMIADDEDIIVCTDDMCTISEGRQKRSTDSDSTNAQTKQTETKEEDKKSGQTTATKFAFGNPALPSQSKKQKGKPKSRRRKG